MNISELKKAGLTDRQAAVYMALLTLGPASVQTIARKAKVARGTTYVVLDHLCRLGLTKTYIQKGRRVFVAESPDQLLTVLEQQKRSLEEASHSIHDLLPTLHAMMRMDGRRLVARYYEGKEGLVAMRQEMTMYSQSRDIWYNLAPVEGLRRVFGHDGIVHPARIKKGIISRTVCLIHSDTLRQELEAQAPQHNVERKFLKLDPQDANCGLTIFRDRIAIGNFDEVLGGMIIESPPLAALLKKFFDVAWRALPASDRMASYSSLPV